MSSPSTCSAGSAYLTKSNIVHPRSERADVIAAAEAAARINIADHLGGSSAITVAGGSIRKGS